MDFGPVADGRDLPHHPFDPTAADVSDDVPVMVGHKGRERDLTRDAFARTASFLATKVEP